MVFFTLMTMSEMGWLPFEMPGWSDLLGMSEPYEPVAQLEGEQAAAVHMIDVGQGDSILIQTREKTVLIDAGERDQGQTVCDYLKSAGWKSWIWSLQLTRIPIISAAWRTCCPNLQRTRF